MTEQEKAGNIVLAEFMDWEVYGSGENHKYYLDKVAQRGYYAYELRFITSLDWLWLVWVKFRNGVTFNDYDQIDVHSKYCSRVLQAFDSGIITDIFNTLVDGVEWYKSINK